MSCAAPSAPSWRKNELSFRFDNLASSTSFLDSAVGLFPAASTFGQDTVKEGYAELVVPVLADLPAVKKFNLELGYRFSDYDSVGNVDTYKALADWTIVDAVRFRGGFQRANRAPNIGELFLPDTQRGHAHGLRRSLRAQHARQLRRESGHEQERCHGAAAARAFCSQLMGRCRPGFYANQNPNAPLFPLATVVQRGNNH